jgi:hypothetical protein
VTAHGRPPWAVARLRTIDHVDLPAAALVCPLYGRPHRTATFVEACDRAATGPQTIYLVCTSDRDTDIAAAAATTATVIVLDGPRQPGDWARKINAAYRATTEPILVLMGDDVTPRPGWHDEVANAYARGFGVIGTQDLGNRRVLSGLHSTHPAVARWYADRHGTVDGPGAIVSEEYHHNYPDQELVETAKARGLWTFCNTAVLEHHHPNWGKGEMDWVYALGREGFDKDRWTYDLRQRLWNSLLPLPRSEIADGSR